MLQRKRDHGAVIQRVFPQPLIAVSRNAFIRAGGIEIVRYGDPYVRAEIEPLTSTLWCLGSARIRDQEQDNRCENR